MDPKNENLEFSLERIEKPVTIGGKAYVLRELDGKQRDTYLNGLSQRVRIVDGKPAGLKSFDGLQASLLALCLYENIAGGEPVPAATIQAWPATVVTRLYEVAREMNGLDEEEEGTKKGND